MNSPISPPRRRCAIAIACAASLTFSASADAAAVVSSWENAVSGIWTAGQFWMNNPAQGDYPNNGNVGVATYDAVINAVGASYSVTLGSSITVEHLTLASANASLFQSSGTFTAHAGLDITAGLFRVGGGTVSNTAISISGSGTLALGGSGTIQGETIMGNNPLQADNGTLDGVNLSAGVSLANATQLDVKNSLTLSANARVILNSNGSSVLFRFASGTQTLGGTGEVLFNGASGNQLVASGGLVQSDASKLTIGPGITIHGGSGTVQTFGTFDSIINQGVISADTSTKTISIGGNFSNQGTLEAKNNGILSRSSRLLPRRRE